MVRCWVLFLVSFFCLPLFSQDDGMVKSYVVNGVSFDMVRVSGGSFKMGAQKSDRMSANYDSLAWPAESPVREVRVSDYMIGKTEVTQALWNAVMERNPSRFKDDNRPVERLFYEDIEAFIFRLNEMTGEAFRLPTEEEWEFAARGGSASDHLLYAGSDDYDQVAVCLENYGGRTDSTAPVMSKAPNVLGVYDMSGNVWERCQGGFRNYYSEETDDAANVIRGGSWGYGYTSCRVSSRLSYGFDSRCSNVGFRLAR